ncbi:MAG: MbcA/ParS/Xre antitoxin family protein [Cellvibrionaceae bacterium]|nr:MbcA/ParS/Xre antitoxin family protein [Cellvibrionaceae bacterium]
MMSSVQALNPITPQMGIKGLRAAFTILDKWTSSPEQQWRILGMKKSTYYKNRDSADKARLSADQLERISYILNIHAALRIVFDNPKNTYGFMAMCNQGPYFNGRAPLDVISSGNFGALYETCKRVDALRSGGW